MASKQRTPSASAVIRPDGRMTPRPAVGAGHPRRGGRARGSAGGPAGGGAGVRVHDFSGFPASSAVPPMTSEAKPPVDDEPKSDVVMIEDPPLSVPGMLMRIGPGLILVGSGSPQRRTRRPAYQGNRTAPRGNCSLPNTVERLSSRENLGWRGVKKLS